MTATTAGLIAFAILVVVAVILLILGRMSETGHGSRIKDLSEILDAWRKAKSGGERALIFFWYLRGLFRLGYYGATVTVVGSLAMAAGSIFGFSWEIAREMLNSVLHFLERFFPADSTHPPQDSGSAARPVPSLPAQ